MNKTLVLFFHQLLRVFLETKINKTNDDSLYSFFDTMIMKLCCGETFSASSYGTLIMVTQ